MHAAGEKRRIEVSERHAPTKVGLERHERRQVVPLNEPHGGRPRRDRHETTAGRASLASLPVHARAGDSLGSAARRRGLCLATAARDLALVTADRASGRRTRTGFAYRTLRSSGFARSRAKSSGRGR